MTTTSAATATATGPDALAGGERWPRPVPSDTPLDLVVAAHPGDRIDLDVTASADRSGNTIDLDVWILDQHGRDRRALSGALSGRSLPGWTVPAGTDEPVTLAHRVEVNDLDIVDGNIHLRLVTTGLLARKLHIETDPLTWSARVVPEAQR